MVKNCVYFITDGYYLKIGIASDLDRRLKQLQTGNARPLHAIAVIQCRNMDEARAIETQLHRSLRDLNVMNEWFLGDRRAIKAAVTKTGKKVDFIAPIPSTMKGPYTRIVVMSIVKEVIEVIGAMTLGAFAVLHEVPLMNDALTFVSETPGLCWFIVGASAVVVLFDCLKRRGYF